jgi:hypothetical protein
MERLSLYQILVRKRTLTGRRQARQQVDDLEREKLYRIRTWPIPRLLHAMYEMKSYMLRYEIIDNLYNHRVLPILRNEVADKRQSLQDLRDVLAFKEWYGLHNTDNAPNLVTTLAFFFPTDDLQTRITALEGAMDLAFMQATHARLGAEAPIHGLSPELLHLITSYSHV